MSLLRQWRNHRRPLYFFRPAIWLLASALGIYGVAWGFGLRSQPTGALALAIAALVLWWIAAFVFCTGEFREFGFPLLLLLLMVPIPAVAMDQVVTALQRASTLAAYGLFYACGVPVAIDGNLLRLPGLELEVAAECSSIRSSMILLVTTILLAHQFLETRWRRWLTVLLVGPFAVAKNGLRIYAIGVLAIKVDRGYLTGRLHRQGGVVFLALAIAGIAATILVLRRGEGAART